MFVCKKKTVNRCCGPKSKTQTSRMLNCLYSINIPGFQRQIDLTRVNFKQIHDEVGPNKVKYPTHDELGFLESKYKLIMSSNH